jgi:hypothetical protein
MATVDDASDAFTLLLIQLAEQPVPQNFGVCNDRSERRAQVVRDVRKKLRLQRVTRSQIVDGALSVTRLRLKRV